MIPLPSPHNAERYFQQPDEDDVPSGSWPVTHASVGEAPLTTWLLALSAAVVHIYGGAEAGQARPTWRSPSSSPSSFRWRRRWDCVRVLGSFVAHAVGPHVVFWYAACVTTSPLLLFVAFVVVVVAAGIVWTGYRETRQVAQQVQQCGWGALCLFADTCPSSTHCAGGEARAALHSRVWPLRTISALLGWFLVTGYCTWRFSIDYFYGFYPFWDHGVQRALAFWLVPSAIVSLVCFVCAGCTSAWPLVTPHTPQTSDARCFFLVPVGAVVTRRARHWYRALSVTLLAMLLAQLYYAYQLSVVLVMLESGLDDNLLRGVEDAASVTPTSVSVDLPTATATATAAASPSCLTGVMLLPCVMRSVLRPPKLVFLRASNPPFWRFAYVYTGLGLLLSVVGVVVGLVYPLWCVPPPPPPRRDRHTRRDVNAHV